MLGAVISIVQAVIRGLVQGLTELFPISILGHSVVIPRLLGWDIDQAAPSYLTLLVAMHLATAIVLVGFFWREWLAIVRGLVRSFLARRVDEHDTYAKLGWLLVVGTIPVGLLGLLFQDVVSKLFASARIAAAMLVINGLVLFAAERLRRKRENTPHSRLQSNAQIAHLSWVQAVGIGLSQAAALSPGISRSGSSMAGGLLAGLDNENAARFSFLLATPVIGAAALLKLPELFTPEAEPMRTAIIAGALCAGVAAFVSVKFLLRYFQTRTLTPFAVYCVVIGLSLSGYFLVH